MAFSVFIYRYEPFKSGFEITDQLGGNIFPATILSTATTDANLIVPADSDYIGTVSYTHLTLPTILLV